MGVEKYNAKILYDPTGFFRKGAEIPWFEFAEMLRSGEIPEGTRIEKVARNSRFRIARTEYSDRPCMVDEDGETWTVSSNRANNNGLEIKRRQRRKLRR